MLEADVEERPFVKLSDRREYLKKVAGVSVSESTLSRAIRKMGFGRKKGLRVLRPWCSRRLAPAV